MLVWIAIVGLLVVLVWVTQLREGFISEGRISTVNDNEQLYHDRTTLSENQIDRATLSAGKLGEGLPDPSALASQLRGLMKRVNPSSDGTIDVLGNDMSPIMNKMQGLLSKYDNPESMGHVLSIKDKDPGELARMYLNINN